MAQMFGFGPQSTLAPMPMQSRPDPMAQAGPPAGFNFGDAQGMGGAPATPPGWSPSAWAVFAHAMHGNGDLGESRRDLTNQHLSDVRAQTDADLQQKAMAGQDDLTRFSMFHDPASFASNNNQQFGFHVIPEANRAIVGGQGVAADPKTSAPAEMETANAATTSAAANAANAANNANETALKALSNPAAIDKLRSDAEWNRRRSAGGAVGAKPGTPKPTGRVF